MTTNEDMINLKKNTKLRLKAYCVKRIITYDEFINMQLDKIDKATKNLKQFKNG